MSAQRFTVERIEAARECIAKLRDSARTGVVIEFRQRDPLVLELHRALDAFALQTRQVEQMREWLDKLEGKHTPQCVASRRLFTRVQQQFTALFPKEGGQ